VAAQPVASPVVLSSIELSTDVSSSLPRRPFPQGLEPKSVKHFLRLPYMLHAVPPYFPMAKRQNN
jgi:hypothetical protein